MAYAKGFDRATDPVDDKGFGMRSHALKSPLITNSTQLDAVTLSYNGFEFPPQSKISATYVPELTSDGRSVKYITLAITVECFITQYDLTLKPTDLASHPSIDTTMDEIRYRLGQSCQALRCTLHGLGTILVNVANTTTVPFLSTAPAKYMDVDFGPKPQVIDWRPVGGSLCAAVQWLVTTRISPCSNLAGQFGMLEHSYDVEWKIDDAGYMVRSVNGKMEVALTRTPSTTRNEASNIIDMTAILLKFQTDYNYVTSYIPSLRGFLREQNFKLSSNKKILSYTITDTESRSPEAFPEGIIKMKMKERLRSNLENGFNVWNWSFQGSFEAALPKINNVGVNSSKRLGLQAFYIMMQDRLGRVGDRVYTTERPNPLSQNEGSIETLEKRTCFIPNLVDISNDITGNGFEITIGYTLFCPQNLLFTATGMLDSIRSGAFSWDRWNKWLYDNNVLSNPINNTQRQVIPVQDFVVDLCNPLVPLNSSSSQENATNTYVSITETPLRQKRPLPEGGWLEFENRFVFRTENNTTVATPLSKGTVAIRESDNSTLIRGGAKFQPKSEAENISTPVITNPTDTVSYVYSIGHAKRFGYPINPPNILSVNGAPVVKHGSDILIPNEFFSGVYDENGKPINWHTLQWRKGYVLTKQPKEWIIRSSGYPATVGM